MRVYLAHSFDGADARSNLLANNPLFSDFLARLRGSNVEVIDPAEVAIPPTLPEERFNYCLREIASSDVLVVVAQKRLGVGVGAEMMYAHMQHRHVFVVCPDDSYYRSSSHGADVVHAFVQSLSTELFSDLEECARAIEGLCP